MKNILFIFIVIAFTSCAKKTSTKTEQITTYFEGFKHSDYNQIKPTIADSLTFIAGDYIMNFTPESYYQQFKWDSVFKPVYKLVSLEHDNEQVIATVSVNSLKFEFLKHNPLTYRHKFYFKSGKINKIEDLGSIDVNWDIWAKERDSLVSWVKSNHPELDGFVHDLSMKGAIDFLKAIELYKKHKG